MADFTNAVVTNAGAAAEATANANGWTIAFTRVQVGSGTGASDSTTLKALTALRTPVTLVSPDPSAPNANLIGINNLVTYQVSVRFEVNSAWVTTQFQLTEAGLFAKLNNGAEFLYAYAYAGAAGDIITNSGSGSPVDNQYTFIIPYSNAPTISVTLGVYPTVNLHASTHLDNGTDPVPPPSTSRSGLCPANNNNALQVLVGSNPPAFGPVPAHETQHLDNGSDALPYPSTTRSGVVLANPNDVTKVYCGSNPPSWQFGLLSIRANKTLYVSTTGDNSTALPDDPSHPWANIQGALNYLTPYFIAPGVTVTISVAAGVYNSATPISVSHPNGQQINIVGAIGSQISATFASNASNVITVSGASGAFSGISVNDYVIALWVAPGDSTQGLYCGAWRVTATTSTTLSFQATTVPPTSLSGVTLTIRKLQTLLKFGAGISGVVVQGNGLGLFENFGLIGTPSGYTAISGFSISGPYAATIQSCAVINWSDSGNSSYGFSAANGSIINITASYAVTCSIGFGSSFTSSQISASACFSISGTWGFLSNQSTQILSACGSHGNVYGFNPTSGGKTETNNCQAYYNGYGALVQYNSFMIIGGSQLCTFTNNSTKDVFLGILSGFVRVTGPPTAYNTVSANITGVNTLSSDGCYFSP